jgi:hypothetical protein
MKVCFNAGLAGVKLEGMGLNTARYNYRIPHRVMVTVGTLVGGVFYSYSHSPFQMLQSVIE